MTRRIEFTVSEEVGELYDRARGDVPMAAWIKRALESALDPVPRAGSTEGRESLAASPAPSRASVPDVPTVQKGTAKLKTPPVRDTWRR